MLGVGRDRHGVTAGSRSSGFCGQKAFEAHLLVVLSPSFRIRKRSVSFVQFSHAALNESLFFDRAIGLEVRMILTGEPPVSGLERFRRSAGINTEDGVVVLQAYRPYVLRSSLLTRARKSATSNGLFM